MRGVELGGALKNVIAIASGVVDGLGFGNNTRAALITRGLAEITRLGVALGAHPRTFSGLAGMGDLILTCTGALSRNRSVGVELAKGRTLDEILAGMTMVAEGVRTARSARDLAQRQRRGDADRGGGVRDAVRGAERARGSGNADAPGAQAGGLELSMAALPGAGEGPRPRRRLESRGRLRRARRRTFYSIGEVCAMLDIKPHVLRYWETQFPRLSPSKNRAGNRVYTGEELELIALIRRLVHDERYTIEGARLRIGRWRRRGARGSTRRGPWSSPSSAHCERSWRTSWRFSMSPSREPPPRRAAPVASAPGRDRPRMIRSGGPHPRGAARES